MSRRDGILYVEVKCEDMQRVRVPIFFSFNVEEEEDGSLTVTRLLPPGVEDFLNAGEMFILKDAFGSVLVKARLKEIVGERGYKLELLGEQMVDHRVYDRFSFCPEDFGDFELKKDSEVISKVKIVDISLSGVKFSLKDEGKFNLSVGDFVLLVQGTKVLNLEIIRVGEERGLKVIGARIVSTNFNLISFIISRYVGRVKELLLQNSLIRR